MSDAENQETPAPTEEKVVFSDEQQQAIDRIISERLAKQASKHEREMADAEARYKSDLAKSRMDADERAKVETEERIGALTKRAEEAEHQLVLKSTEAELARLGIPAELAGNVIGSTEEETHANIKALDRAINQAAEKRYAERVAKGAPKEPTAREGSDDAMRRVMRQASGLQ